MRARSLPLLLVLLAWLAAAVPAQARELKVGIAADGVLLNGSPEEADKAVAEWRRLGVDTVRLQVQWSRVAPDPHAYQPPPGFDPGNPDAGYHWGHIDAAVARIVAAGMEPMLLLGGPPPLWASSRPLAGNPRWQPSSWHFGQFAAAVARRYSAFVTDYVLWNEPNLPLWLQPQARCVRKTRCSPVSPHVYRFMVRAAYPAIHAADAQSRVLIGALAPAGSHLRSRNANMRPLHWLRNFGCIDKRGRRVRTSPCHTFEPAMADGFAYHPHSTKHPPDEGYPRPDDAALADLRNVERLLDRLQRTGRLIGTTTPLGLWLDEYAYQTNPPDKVRGVAPWRQDSYLQHAAYLAWRDRRVQLLAQYLWKDEAVGDGKRYTGWQSGLLAYDGTPKPALAHFDDPLWVDVRRNLVWGQIRPGRQHDVRLQMRPAGAGTAWRTLGEVRTAADGTWYVRTPVELFASYRAVYDGGRVTGTHVAAPPWADKEVDVGGPQWSDGLLVERRAAAPAPGAPLPRSFAGMSIEYGSVPDYIGSGEVLNPVFRNLVATLARGANGAPTLRFGGDSADQTWWNPTGALRPPGVNYDITPEWLGHLARWVHAARTPLIIGLNMGLGDPAHGAAIASAARATLPRWSLRNFELGNEPDLYPTPRTYVVGRKVLVRGQRRPAGYGFDQYREEVAAHIAAIHPAAPDVGLSAGGFASSNWDGLQDDVLSTQPSVRAWSAHSYPLQTCDRDIRAEGERYIPKVLAPSAYLSVVDRMRRMVAVANAHGAAVQVSEMNSAICGGLVGMSDTFAAALWAADVLFGLADAGVRNVDFHMWTGSHYGAVNFTTDEAGRPVARVRPLFYALWLFNRATPPGSRLLAVGPNPPDAKLKTWATVDRRGTRRFVVINKDRAAGRKVVLRMTGAARTASVERLVAPALKSKHHATLGGLGFGAQTRDGIPRGRRKAERIRVRSGTLRLRMPVGSAALVTVRPSLRAGRRP